MPCDVGVKKKKEKTLFDDKLAGGYLENTAKKKQTQLYKSSKERQENCQVCLSFTLIDISRDFEDSKGPLITSVSKI